MSQELQVLQDYYDFSVELLKRLQKFPRDLRYGLGRSIEMRIEWILKLFIHAKYSPKAEKAEILIELNIELEVLRFQIRQVVDLKAMPIKAQGFLLDRLIEIGKQVGGWKSSLTAQPK
jgi:hypothetical protein